MFSYCTNVVHIVAIAIEGTVELHVVGAVGREQVVMVKMVAQVSPKFAQHFFFKFSLAFITISLQATLAWCFR
jgi:hypothetical protein